MGGTIGRLRSHHTASAIGGVSATAYKTGMAASNAQWGIRAGGPMTRLVTAINMDTRDPAKILFAAILRHPHGTRSSIPAVNPSPHSPTNRPAIMTGCGTSIARIGTPKPSDSSHSPPATQPELHAVASTVNINLTNGSGDRSNGSRTRANFRKAIQRSNRSSWNPTDTIRPPGANSSTAGNGVYSNIAGSARQVPVVHRHVSSRACQSRSPQWTSTQPSRTRTVRRARVGVPQ